MKRKEECRSLFCVILVGALLSSCENTDYRAEDCTGNEGCGALRNIGVDIDEENTSLVATEYMEKSGVTGQIFDAEYWVGALVCFDNNGNGNCDESEPQERSFEAGKFSFDAAAIEFSVNSNVPLLAVKILPENLSAVLYAPAPGSNTAKGVNITAFTTVVMNEVAFNPYTLNSPVQSRAFLLQGDFVIGDEAVLSGEDYIAEGTSGIIQQASDIADSLYQAQSLGIAQNYKAGAAVIDAMYQQRSYKATIGQAAIDAQTIRDEEFTASLSSSTIEWILGHEDESSTDIHVQGNHAVVGSQYHNRLVVFDLTTDVPVLLSRNDFAASPDVERDEIDAITGASEQVLRDVRIISNDLHKSVLVGVNKYTNDGEDIGVGLYRADFSDPSFIPMKRFAEDDGSQNFYAFPGLNKMAISSDASSVVLSGENKKLTVLDTNDFSVKQEFFFASKVRSAALNETGTIAFASLFGQRIGWVVLDVVSGRELAFSPVSRANYYPENYKVFGEQERIAMYLRDSNLLSINDISDLTMAPQAIGQISVEKKIKGFDISSDGKLAIVAMNGGRLELHFLGSMGNDDKPSPPRLIEIFQLEENKFINGVVFDTDERVLVSVKNGLKVLDIKLGLPAREWSDEQKSEWFLQHRYYQE